MASVDGEGFLEELLQTLRQLNAVAMREAESCGGSSADPSIHIWNEVFQEPGAWKKILAHLGSEEGGMNGQMGNGEDTTLSGDFASPGDNISVAERRLAKIVMYDIVKFCPVSDLEAWSVILQSIKVDLSRADDTDHTFAALSVLNSLPPTILLDFVTTAEAEGPLIACLEHETCDAIRIAAIEHLVDLFLRACYKIDNEHGNGLKSRPHESTMHERRQVYRNRITDHL